MSVGEKIRQLRLEKGMTQEDLGRALGVGKAAIQKYESGQVQNLKSSHIKTLCELFNVHPITFIFDEDEIDAMNDSMEAAQLTCEVEKVYGKGTGDLMSKLQHLNRIGRKKVLDYILDLLEAEKYRSSR